MIAITASLKKFEAYFQNDITQSIKKFGFSQFLIN